MKFTKPVIVKNAIKEIKEAQAPLTLNLSSNNIEDAGIRFLAEAMKGIRVPVKLKLKLRDRLRFDGRNVLHDAQKDSFIKDARSKPSEFFAKLKFNLFNPLTRIMD